MSIEMKALGIKAFATLSTPASLFALGMTLAGPVFLKSGYYKRSTSLAFALNGLGEEDVAGITAITSLFSSAEKPLADRNVQRVETWAERNNHSLLVLTRATGGSAHNARSVSEVGVLLDGLGKLRGTPSGRPSYPLDWDCPVLLLCGYGEMLPKVQRERRAERGRYTIGDIFVDAGELFRDEQHRKHIQTELGGFLEAPAVREAWSTWCSSEDGVARLDWQAGQYREWIDTWAGMSVPGAASYTAMLGVVAASLHCFFGEVLTAGGGETGSPAMRAMRGRIEEMLLWAGERVR